MPTIFCCNGAKNSSATQTDRSQNLTGSRLGHVTKCTRAADRSVPFIELGALLTAFSTGVQPSQRASQFSSGFKNVL